MKPTARTMTFGDDHSAGADGAWAWITAHPWPHWSVEVVTVTTPMLSTPASPYGRTELAPWDPPEPRQAPSACEFDSVIHLTAAHDPRIILSERASDLVVVGPRGEGLIKGLLVGSTADWLMRCPSAPLVIAREPAITRSMLVCVDGSRHAQAAVDFLVSMPWVASTSVTVIGIVEREDELRDHVMRAAEQFAAAGAHANPLVMERDARGITVNPHWTILEHMAAHPPDLVAMGTSGLSGLQRLWVGSVSGAVTRHVSCSVLLVRDPYMESSA